MNLTKIIKELENPCWKGYEMVGMKDKDGRDHILLNLVFKVIKCHCFVALLPKYFFKCEM